MEPTTTGWLASWGQGGKLGRGEGALSFCYFGCSGDESLYLFLFSSGRGRLPCIEGIYKGEAMANAQVNYLAHVDTGEGRGVGGKRGGGVATKCRAMRWQRPPQFVRTTEYFLELQTIPK